MTDPADRPDERVPDERAQAIWRRAAQLQADAAARLEERSRSLARREPGQPPDGYRRADIEAAAVEAGIAPEFVRLAMAEDAGQLRRTRLSPRLDRIVTRLLATDRRTVEASRVLRAAPADVFEAMTRLFPQHPYRLELRDTIGDNLHDGGVLVFGTPGYHGMENDFALDMAYADMKELHVVLRPVLEGARVVATEVTVTSDLEYGRKLNLFVGGGVIGAGATGGGAVAGAVVGAGLGALVALPVVAGAAAGGGLMAMGYRALYRWGIGRGARALERLLSGLDVNVRTRGAFATPPEPPPASS